MLRFKAMQNIQQPLLVRKFEQSKPEPGSSIVLDACDVGVEVGLAHPAVDRDHGAAHFFEPRAPDFSLGYAS